MGKNQHVVPANGQWGVRGAGNTRLTSLHDTQAEAAAAAREIARNQSSELIIHRPNGQIRERNSYGNDPYPPEG
jgi:cytochrome b